MTSLNVKLDTKRIATIYFDSKENTFTFAYTDTWTNEEYAISPHLPFNKTITSLSIKR
jgi:hypothetical protein